MPSISPVMSGSENAISAIALGFEIGVQFRDDRLEFLSARAARRNADLSTGECTPSAARRAERRDGFLRATVRELRRGEVHEHARVVRP